MLFRTMLGFLCGVTVVDTTQLSPLPLLLVSFDGFRADYLKRFHMPNLKNLYSQGVLVEELTNVFITKTFPNHYTLVTGLYAESHGMLASNMYDPISGKTFHASRSKDPMWWNKAQPLWVTALDFGHKTAAVMWPGSDVIISNRTATHFLPYNSSVTFKERLGNVTKWLLGNEKEPGVMFAALYWEEPDHFGHRYGPENTEAMSKALEEVDEDIGLLVSELKRLGLWGRINIIVTSDHGMAQLSDERIIRLDDCVDPESYTLVDTSTVAALLPHDDPKAIFALLSKCHIHMTAYLKTDIPDRLHYRDSERIQPIILVADEGWTIMQRGDKVLQMGDHGYDNSLHSMHPFMAAMGPSFREGYRIGSLRSVDIYPLMCHLLSVPPQPNNGSLARIRCLLAAENCNDAPLVISLVVGILLLTATIIIILGGPSSRLRRCRRGDPSHDLEPWLH